MKIWISIILIFTFSYSFGQTIDNNLILWSSDRELVDHRLMKNIQQTKLLIIDDFGINPFDQNARQALMDIVDYKYDKSSIIITSQIPVTNWHDLIGEGTIADAILDRIVHASHRINLHGESLRKIES